MEIGPLKEVPNPGRLTTGQVEEHRTRAHLPFRSLCRWCCLGRGRLLQHHATERSAVPTIGLDYFFATDGGVQLREDMDVDDEAVRAALS